MRYSLEIKSFWCKKKMAHHFLKKLVFEKNFFAKWPWPTVFCKKKFFGFFFQKIFTKITNIIFTYYQKFSDWQKLTENFQYPNFYIFVKLNLFRSLFTIFYIYIVIFDWHAKLFVLFKYWLPLRLNNSWEFVLNY